MEIRIERGAAVSELIIEEGTETVSMHQEENEYEYEMITGNTIPVFLSLGKRFRNYKVEYVYDVTSMLSLKELSDRRPLRYLELCMIIDSLEKCRLAMDEYLLSPKGIILNPEYIFYDSNNRCLRFCIYPDYTTDLFTSYTELSEYLLSAIDYTEEDTVKLAYEIYAGVLDKNYEFERIADMERYRSYLSEVEKTENHRTENYRTDNNTKVTDSLCSQIELDSQDSQNSIRSDVNDSRNNYVSDQKNYKDINRISKFSVFCIICLIVIITMVLTAFLINRRLMIGIIRNKKYMVIGVLVISFLIFIPVLNIMDVKGK